MHTRIAVGLTALGFVGLLLMAAQFGGDVLYLATVFGGTAVVMTYVRLMR
ncbi:hypothetical protein [Roseibium sp.]